MGMSHATPVLGVDVAKDRLDCFASDTGEAFSLDTTPQGYAALLARCRRQPCIVALEASGGYEKPLLAALAKAGIAARLLDPRRVRHFACSCGQLAKNDRLDARMIAAYAQAVPGEPHRPDPARERLAELVHYRRQLVAHEATFADQASHLADPALLRDARRASAALRLRIKALELRISAMMAQDPAFGRKAAILRSIPGIGPVACAALLAEMPELGQLDRRKAAALLGVAPMDNSSGRRNGPRSIRGGRPALPAVLEMAAQAAARTGAHFAAFKQRLRHAGKKPKVAITAVMRKLIVLANALIRDNKTFSPA